MILSDRDIIAEIKKGVLSIRPFDTTLVQPSSVDLRLGSEFRIFKHARYPLIDVKRPFGAYTQLVRIKENGRIVCHPGEFVLGTTLEKVKIPTHLVGRLEGKSSLGRLGILIHCSAGYVDPGFEGNLTLEINNVGKIPVALYPGMRIAQISFSKLTSKAKRPYGVKDGKYQHQSGPTESRVYKEFME